MIGDQNDILQRIKSTLPRWFSDESAVLGGVLVGLSRAWSFAHDLYTYAKQQTRIMTATDGWLDMIAADFFGASIRRAANQTDASFRARIVANLLREKGTRDAIVKVLTDITGRAPRVFEPARPADSGGYGYGAGYGVAGGYGSLMLPYQAFVTAYRPASSGIPNVAGYGGTVGGVGPGGYGVASQLEYASISMIQGAITDADIYAAVDAVAPAGVVVWTQITN